MKKHILILLAVTLMLASLNAQDPLEIKGPYLGQEPPGDSSIVFAPGFVATDAGELNSVFCCDGNEFYFSRRGIPGKSSVLMMTKITDDGWSQPAELKFSGNYSDIDLFITPDGKSLVFCSRRPYDEGQDEKPDHDFWISKRNGDAWSEPEPFASEAMSEYEDFYPVITASGNLYFNSQRGGQPGNNIYCSQFLDGKYTEAIKLPEPINSGHWEFDAFLTQDENMIVFSSTRPGGYGGADIYVSRKDSDDNWSEPGNLGPAVNSDSYEYGASISPDGKYFFFTSSRNGSEDIFWVSADVLNREPADVVPPELIDYGKIFMDHLMKNWDDIHDVIMRYHYEDPWLKGKAVIRMTWQEGRLVDASVVENTTGNPAFGLDLITAMKRWEISEITGSWSSAVPIKTSIKGSDQPDFSEYGILTGKVTDAGGNPVPGASILMQAKENTGGESKTFTNREGIFIQTLIPPGKWHISISKQGYDTLQLKSIEIEKSKHCKRDIVME